MSDSSDYEGSFIPWNLRSQNEAELEGTVTVEMGGTIGSMISMYVTVETADVWLAPLDRNGHIFRAKCKSLCGNIHKQ